ncbi:MAG: DUF222 domain-containing protein [Mycobacteriaceae bacterium]
MIETPVVGDVGGGAADLEILAVSVRAEGAAVAAKLAAAGRLWRAEVESVCRSEFMACQVATALSVSTGMAYTLMQLGDDLDQRLPGCRLALGLGLIDLARVRVIATQTEHITDPLILAEAKRQILAVVLTPGRCYTPNQVRALANRVVTRLDPDAAITRRVKAEQDREVTVRPATDGTSTLWGCLRAVDGADLDTALRTMALGVCGQDPRTLAQARADALLALVRGQDHLPCQCGSPGCPDTPTDAANDTDGELDPVDNAGETAPSRRRRRTRARSNVVVHVVVDNATLLGAADLPGVLARYGIIDPDLVRTLAADARWQRLLTLDGIPTHLGPLIPPGTPPDTPQTLRYTPTPRVADRVRTRDQHCRFPACTIPAASCDLDHVTPYNTTHPLLGGRTVVANLACLCRWHHRAKTEKVWTVTMNTAARQDWTGPHGQKLHTEPTGMPPTPNGTDPPSTSAPVHPTPPEPPPAWDFPPDHEPPDDFPPDDHPPPRWTPDGHWANDPLSDRDHTHALTALDEQDADHARTERLIRLGAPRKSFDNDTFHVNDPHEPPPF